jgi:hypothetical protein
MTRWKLRAVFAMTLIATAISAAAGQQPAGGGGTVIGPGGGRGDEAAPLRRAGGGAGRRCGASANAEGRFVIRNVPVGNQTVRVQLFGFAPKEQTVSVTASGTARRTSR